MAQSTANMKDSCGPDLGEHARRFRSPLCY